MFIELSNNLSYIFSGNIILVAITLTILTSPLISLQYVTNVELWQESTLFPLSALPYIIIGSLIQVILINISAILIFNILNKLKSFLKLEKKLGIAIYNKFHLTPQKLFSSSHFLTILLCISIIPFVGVLLVCLITGFFKLNHLTALIISIGGSILLSLLITLFFFKHLL